MSPALGHTKRDIGTNTDPNPKEGPPGIILLRVRRVGQKPPRPRDSAGDLLRDSTGKLFPPAPDAYRFWLDPARDYAVVRSDMITTDDSVNEETHSTIIDKMAKSPQGTWYATQIRRKGAIRTPSDGKTYDQIIDLYVDFNVNLPDSLFEPPAPGRIH